MFVKLILLILALGSTGVGVLSVRQSRLIASNEMTQTRLRTRDLDRRTMELRAQIASRVTPDQIRAIMGERLDASMVDETQRRIDLLDPREPARVVERQRELLEEVSIISSVGPSIEQPIEEEPDQMLSQPIDPGYWTLDDGTRVYVVD